MTLQEIERREKIRRALKAFVHTSLAKAATQLLHALGYASEKTADLGNSAEALLSGIEQFRPELGKISRDKVMGSRWKSCAFLFQLTDDEIPSLLANQPNLSQTSSRSAREAVARSEIESFVFLAIELQNEQWSRTDLAAITRELNRRFPMPAIVIFIHEGLLSLAVIDRRRNLRDATRDVINSRITVIKDVRLANPHRAHIDILASLALSNLGEKRSPSDFRELYDAWIGALSTQALNKRFYTELAWWYFWGVKQVDFPKGGGMEAEKRNSIAVIRLLTRLIFVWFIKEKGLIPAALFARNILSQLLKTDPGEKPEGNTYYLGILQNLFFATLNVEMGKDRRWADAGGGMKSDRLIHSLYRHKELFRNAAAALELFCRIPFLNGGLFECLDRDLTERDFQRNPELKQLASREGNGWVLRVDGFSRRVDAQPKVPNKIFFGGEREADLNDELGTKGKVYEVQGLLDIFERYKFTVEENTPLEEEVALDPELLGKVFENLLASYNEDTRKTARKQSGSFYTPREVVDYMVDEALIAYFQRHLPGRQSEKQTGDIAQNHRPINEVLDLGASTGELDLAVAPHKTESAFFVRSEIGIEHRLQNLLSYQAEGNAFGSRETIELIVAIERLKILDPACGSGAFPMGVLSKLVHILKKLDPDNALWRAQNLAPLQAQLAEARKIPDLTLRESRVEEAEAALEKFQRDFSSNRHADYTRKLYLIEKCIHGVDIQPIAVQIAKLRFFIALVVSQQVDETRDNWGITALPNLETKIIAADSLAPIREVKSGMTESFQLGHGLIKSIETELHSASERYFSARTSKTKRKYRGVIQELRDRLAGELEQGGFSTDKAWQLVHWDPFDQNAAADFFDPEWMFQLTGGFDIIIGNPPYVRQEDIKQLKDQLRAHYECYVGTADLYVYFYERSIGLLKPGGAFAFITSNKWFRANYGEKLRDWMNQQTLLRKVIDFGDEAVFTAIAYPIIIIATRRATEVKQPAASERLRALNWDQKHPVEMFAAVFGRESFEVPQAELTKSGWQLEPSEKRQLLKRIRAAGKPLGEYVDGRFYYGIKTGLNDAFVIDGAKRGQLITEDPKSVEIIKPLLRGRDVKRWGVEPEDLWLIFTRRPFDIARYPGIYNHLVQFRKPLEPKPAYWNDKKDGKWPGRKAGSYQWYEIQDNIAYWQEFEQPKIFVPAIEDGVEYAPDLQGYYGNDKTNVIVSEEWRYLLAILNSTLSWWFTRQTFSGKQGGYYEFKPMYVSQVPIPVATSRQKVLLDVLVNCILEYRDLRFEQLINGLVFELFFPGDLHRINIRLFEACTQAGVGNLASFKNEILTEASRTLADCIFAPSRPISEMLANLKRLEVVRIIEGCE